MLLFSWLFTGLLFDYASSYKRIGIGLEALFGTAILLERTRINSRIFAMRYLVLQTPIHCILTLATDLEYFTHFGRPISRLDTPYLLDKK